MQYHPISQFCSEADIVKFVVDAVKKDKDILVCFDHGKLKGDDIQGGHVCVIDRIYPSKGLIRLIDPQQNQPKWRVVKIKALVSAMGFHGDDKSAGFWEFKKMK